MRRAARAPLPGLPGGAAAKFYLECGTPVALGEGPSRAPAPSSADADIVRLGERRQLTVLFCDLVGSTPLSQQLDAEEWRDLIAQYQQAAAGAVVRFGGHVAKNLAFDHFQDHARTGCLPASSERQ